MTIRSLAPRAVLVGALASGALALWLSTGAPSHAASANQVQGTVVSVQGKAISWEDNAGCAANRASSGRPSPTTTADFGSSPPGGGSLSSSGFLGCVLSNATWNVEAVATPLVNTDGSGASIQAANVELQALGLDESQQGAGNGDPSPAPVDPACDWHLASFCSLGTTHPVVVGAAPSPNTSGFLYWYRLDVPASAPSGTYTGSVTLTASN